MKDMLISELRKIRDEHAARFNYDLEAVAEELRKREKETRGKIVNRKPRRFATK